MRFFIFFFAAFNQIGTKCKVIYLYVLSVNLFLYDLLLKDGYMPNFHQTSAVQHLKHFLSRIIKKLQKLKCSEKGY